MKAKIFVDRLVDIAKNYKTFYVMGCFGAPMTAANKTRYTQNHEYNKAADRVAMINAASADTFGFDCVCLIKGVLWGVERRRKPYIRRRELCRERSSGHRGGLYD